MIDLSKLREGDTVAPNDSKLEDDGFDVGIVLMISERTERLTVEWLLADERYTEDAADLRLPTEDEISMVQARARR